MKPIRIEDIHPETGEFKLQSTGPFVHEMRPMSLSDSAWMVQKFGGRAGVEEMFTTVNMEKISMLAFRLLKDKSKFEAVEAEEYDDEGRKRTVFLSGPERLRQAICGPREQISMIEALLKTIGVSQPLLEEGEKPEKKKKVKGKPATRK